jgi:hypothetical protein
MLPQAGALKSSQIWAFATVAMPLGMLGLPMAIYLAPFYAGQLGLPLSLVGFALILARVSDFITDPIMGIVTDRWRPTIGRRRIWLIIGTLIMMAGVQLLLRPPATVGLVWFGLCVGLVYLGYTTLQIPYEAWAGELSGDYHMRTRISATKQGFSIFGLVVATAIPAYVLSKPGANSGDVLGAIAIGVLIVLPITAALAFFTTPEPAPKDDAPALNLKTAITVMAANKPFRLLVIVVLIATIGEVFRQTITVFFARDVVGVKNRCRNQHGNGLFGPRGPKSLYCTVCRQRILFRRDRHFTPSHDGRHRGHRHCPKRPEPTRRLFCDIGHGAKARLCAGRRLATDFARCRRVQGGGGKFTRSPHVADDFLCGNPWHPRTHRCDVIEPL